MKRQRLRRLFSQAACYQIFQIFWAVVRLSIDRHSLQAIGSVCGTPCSLDLSLLYHPTVAQEWRECSVLIEMAAHPWRGAAHLLSPWHGAIKVEPYQLYPVLKALAMPRVSLLLADDVGLGKTVEAGLILSELIARRRVRRALVICPAALQIQWQEELRSKFNLAFERMDRSRGAGKAPNSSRRGWICLDLT